MPKGFTLLELLIVIAILAVLSSIGIGEYRNYVKNVELEEAGKILSYDLVAARTKAAAGEDQRKWGIRLVNSSSQYYLLFSTPTDFSDAQKTVKATTTLTGNIVFSTPSSGNSLDIIFSKIQATTTTTSASLTVEGKTKTITINSNGSIY